jgi:hypothetical protein
MEEYKARPARDARTDYSFESIAIGTGVSQQAIVDSAYWSPARSHSRSLLCCICSQPLLAQMRHADAGRQCLVIEVKRTYFKRRVFESASDRRTSFAQPTTSNQQSQVGPKMVEFNELRAIGFPGCVRCGYLRGIGLLPLACHAYVSLS